MSVFHVCYYLTFFTLMASKEAVISLTLIYYNFLVLYIKCHQHHAHVDKHFQQILYNSM